MPNSKHSRYSIGAAAREVGVSTHVLRKWESRNHLIEPHRSENGRRTYSPDQIQSLRLIKRLTTAGIGLPQLTGLALADLQAMAQQLERTTTAKISVVGSPFFSETNQTELNPVFSPIAENLNEWLLNPTQPDGTVIIGLANLDDSTLSRVADPSLSSTRLIIIYRYSQPAVLRRAKSAGIQAFRGPISQSLAQELFSSRPAHNQPTRALPPAPPRRIDLAEVRRFSALSSSVACECPAHVADLLADLNAFENYSLECISQQPTDSEMHEYLHQVAANARSLFETALERLAKYENLELDPV